MGLLDTLRQGGSGGLLDMLMYRSPLLEQKPEAQQPQYDAMGGFTGFMSGPSFNAAPNNPIFPAQLPQAAPVTGVDMADLSRRMGFPQQAPTSQASVPAPIQQPAATPAAAERGPGSIAVGDYQMPRIGGVSDFTPDPTAIPLTATPTQGQFQPSPMATPSFMGGQQEAGIGDRLSAALQNFANAGGPLQALAGGISGLTSGNRTDATGTTLQNQRAQFAALSPILGPQKAMLAVMNPEAGKILLAQALDKQTPKFGVVRKDADGREIYGFINERQQNVNEYTPTGGSQSSDTVTGPNGEQIPIPPNVDRKAFIKSVTEASADALTGKKTEVQAKSEKFGNKMELAERSLKTLQGQGLSLFNHIASGVPVAGNYALSGEYQKYNQAKNNFITALLRDESGAAIGTQEFQRYERELFPQPGDSPETIAQKSQARQVALDGMKKAAGPGYKSIPDAASSGLPAGWSVKAR